MAEVKKKEFLVVFEDLWNNKESVRTTRIGDEIKNFIDNNDLVFEYGDLDLDKYNSDDPFEAGTTGPGFYDLSFVDSEGEYAGRIMIFYLGETE